MIEKKNHKNSTHLIRGKQTHVSYQPSLEALNIDKAWEILNKHYGDPSNTMKARKDSLNNIGKLPSDTSKGNLTKQLEWYIKLDHIISEIIELGGRSTEMDREAFSQSTITTVLNLFPSGIMAKLLKIGIAN